MQIFNIARQNPLLDFLMVFGAEYLIFIVIIVALLVFLKNRQGVLQLIISLSIGVIAIKTLDLVFYEPRPFLIFNIIPLVRQPIEGSFPSMHTAILTIMAFSFIKAKRKFGQMMLIPVVWTGFARIYTGVHYPLDILGGAIVGILSVIITARFFQKVKHF